MNSFDGQIKLNLFGKVYPMTINLRVMASFRSETGKDFNAFCARVLDAWSKTDGADFYAKAAMMAEAVPMDFAAWAFYLAAKESDSQVSFEEIQDAVLNEGVILKTEVDSGKAVNQTYPVIFSELAIFALLGAPEIKAKPDQKKSSGHS